MALRNQIKKNLQRKRRRRRIRKRLVGTSEKPRLVVYRSLRNIEAQIIDDLAGHSLVGLSTLSRELDKSKFDNRIEQGKEIGKLLAHKAREQGIEQVLFDRGGFSYHGIVKAVADGAREGGLQF
jgi:large subunit ribosomal protein L18